MCNFFKPYIGEAYKKHGVMILGEAHICGECSCECCQANKDEQCINGHVALVNKQIKTGSIKTYRMLEKEFFGAPIEDEGKRQEFYNQFLFTNLLEVAMPKSGQAPNESYYSEACRQRFLDIVQKYQPGYMIVLGNRTFEHLPGNQDDMWTMEKEILNGDHFEIWTLMYKGVSVRVLTIYHPAWIGMSNEKFEIVRKRISYLLKKSN